MRSILIGTLMCALAGCTSKQPSQPIVNTPTVEVVKPTPTPVVVQPPVPEPKRNDLPLNWSEVKGDVWSYGVPMGFDAVQHEYNVLAAHESSTQQLYVTLDTDTNAAQSLQDYVTIWLLTAQNVSHKEVLQTGLKETPSGPIVAVQLVWETDRTQFSSSIEFFIQRIDTIYHVSCTSDNIAMLKKHSQTCFDIMDTFRFK